MKTTDLPGIRAPRGRLILLAASILALVCGCGPSAQEAQNNGKAAENCIPVQIARVQSRDLEEIVRGIGTLEAAQRVVIHPEIGGLIESVNFEEGAAVKKGDLLFTIEDDKIQDQLDAKQAALEEARANLENARLVYNRRQRLYKQELGTEESRDEARARYQALCARVKRLKAEIASIRETLDDTRIRAPFEGIMAERMVDAGQLVGTDTVLSEIVQTGRMKIAFTVPERYLGQVRKGQPVRLTTPTYPQEPFTGTVYFASPQLAPSTRSLLVKAELENPGNRLRPGGFAAVELIVDVRRNAAVIPEEALVPTRSGYMVFTVPDSRAKGRQVQIGLRRPGIVEITEGLKSGQKIIQTGHISVHEGARVCPKDGSS